jgi:hypothetical protein
VPDSRPPAESGTMTGCRAPWGSYCRSIHDAITYARHRGKDVLFVTQPYLLGDVGVQHIDQQQELAAMIARDFKNDPHVRYANLGDSINLAAPEMSFDRMHLTPLGNEHAAGRLVEPILEMAARAGVKR